MLHLLAFYLNKEAVVLNNSETMDEKSKSLSSEEIDIVGTENKNSHVSTESLSKRAQRKLLKRQQWLETRPERRKKEKAKKRAKIEKIRQEKGVLFNIL